MANRVEYRLQWKLLARTWRLFGRRFQIPRHMEGWQVRDGYCFKKSASGFYLSIPDNSAQRAHLIRYSVFLSESLSRDLTNFSFKSVTYSIVSIAPSSTPPIVLLFTCLNLTINVLKFFPSVYRRLQFIYLDHEYQSSNARAESISHRG